MPWKEAEWESFRAGSWAPVERWRGAEPEEKHRLQTRKSIIYSWCSSKGNYSYLEGSIVFLSVWSWLLCLFMTEFLLTQSQSKHTKSRKSALLFSCTCSDVHFFLSHVFQLFKELHQKGTKNCFHWWKYSQSFSPTQLASGKNMTVSVSDDKMYKMGIGWYGTVFGVLDSDAAGKLALCLRNYFFQWE